MIAELPRNLIQLDMLEFDIILGMGWLTTRGASIDSRDLKVTLKDQEGQEVYFYGERLSKESIISIVKARKLLR